jgi:hypothetical protein
MILIEHLHQFTCFFHQFASSVYVLGNAINNWKWNYLLNVFIIRHVVYSIVQVRELVTHQGCTLTAVKLNEIMHDA